MRRIVIVTIILLSFMAEIAFAFQNEPEGFRDLKWGDSPAGDMELIDSAINEMIYQRSNVKSHIGGVEFFKIDFIFLQKRVGSCGCETEESFVGVHLYFKGKENYDILKMLLRDRFGEETYKGGIELEWEGNKTIILLNYEFIFNGGELIFESNQLFKKLIDIDEKEQIEKAKDDW